MTDTAVATSTTVGKLLGTVKWFNNRKGFGFITIISEEQKDKDVFVHQSNIIPLQSTYRTLSMGEYVSLDVSSDEKEQAINVTGVYGGQLQCDIQLQRSKNKNRRQHDYEDSHPVVASL